MKTVKVILVCLFMVFSFGVFGQSQKKTEQKAGVKKEVKDSIKKVPKNQTTVSSGKIIQNKKANTSKKKIRTVARKKRSVKQKVIRTRTRIRR